MHQLFCSTCSSGNSSVSSTKGLNYDIIARVHLVNVLMILPARRGPRDGNIDMQHSKARNC